MLFNFKVDRFDKRSQNLARMYFLALFKNLSKAFWGLLHWHKTSASAWSRPKKAFYVSVKSV